MAGWNIPMVVTGVLYFAAVIIVWATLYYSVYVPIMARGALVMLNPRLANPNITPDSNDLVICIEKGFVPKSGRTHIFHVNYRVSWHSDTITEVIIRLILLRNKLWDGEAAVIVRHGSYGLYKPTEGVTAIPTTKYKWGFTVRQLMSSAIWNKSNP